MSVPGGAVAGDRPGGEAGIGGVGSGAAAGGRGGCLRPDGAGGGVAAGGGGGGCLRRDGSGGSVAAGAAVGGVAPGGGQPGDDRGAAAADHQREPSGELADHVRGGHVVAGSEVLAVDLPRRLPAQLGRGVQGGDVGDAGQEHLDRGGVQDDLAAVV